MNPYDFVRIDWTRAPERHAAKPHHRFEALSGRIEGSLTTLTPLFLPAKRPDGSPLIEMGGAGAFSQSRSHETRDNPRGYFIAGSSLKGLFRSVVEAVAPGCFWFFDGKYKSRKDGAVIETDYSMKLPADFRRCSSLGRLCPSCRLFGLIEGEALRLGNVGFEDAICTDAQPHDAIFTPILDGPKPRHDMWYLQNNKITGRKFYFHSQELREESELKKSRSGETLNAHIHPLGVNSSFTFAAEFINVEEQDFAALLYAMTLEAEMRHKFGYAKPCGLGSVHIQLTKLILRDPTARYRQGAGNTVYEGETLTTEVSRRVTPFGATIPPITLTDLRRIWRWPPVPGVNYRYPTQAQFAAHPRDPISSTDSW